MKIIKTIGSVDFCIAERTEPEPLSGAAHQLIFALHIEKNKAAQMLEQSCRKCSGLAAALLFVIWSRQWNPSCS